MVPLLQHELTSPPQMHRPARCALLGGTPDLAILPQDRLAIASARPSAASAELGQLPLSLVTPRDMDDDRTILRAGLPVAEVSAESGIRQGCPLRSSLFAVALDPLLRRLMAHRLLTSVA